MDMKTWLQQASKDQRQALATSCSASVGHLYAVAGGHRQASAKLCRILVKNEPRLTLHALRPDIWPDLAASPFGS